MSDPNTPRSPLQTDSRYSSIVLDGKGRPARLSGGADAELPEPLRVARRALVLMTLAWRSALERHRPAGAEAQLPVAKAWAEARGLREEMEEDELRLVSAAPWTWTEREVIESGWLSEGAAVLVWALGGPALPPHDEQVDAVAVGKAAGLFTAAPSILEAPALREVGELAWMRNRVLGIRWRLRELARKPEKLDFQAVARQRWPERFDFAGVPLADGDLAVGGVAIAAAPEAAVKTVNSIAIERHRAIEWICGEDPLWSRVSVDSFA